jgi:hypothetical protein
MDNKFHVTANPSHPTLLQRSHLNNAVRFFVGPRSRYSGGKGRMALFPAI